jgi:two-component system, OmpR family, phosphate regulon sensor histidine kinase PhoR
MSFTNSITLVINALTIALAMAMLTLLLWQDSRSSVNLIFGILMVMVVTWSVGMLLSRISAYIGSLGALTEWGVRLLIIGYSGSCIGIYLFTVILTGGQSRLFMRIAAVVILLVLLYQAFLALSTTAPAFDVRPDGTLRYSFGAAATIVYAGFTIVTIVLAWQRRRKIHDTGLLRGIYGFSLGMLIELVSPELRNHSIGMDISAISVFVISYSLVRTQIIEPLAGRANQLKAVRDVGLAITSRVRLEEVLSTIAAQAAGILQADGAAIFLRRAGVLELAAVHNMPSAFLGQRLMIGEGLAGQVAASRQSYRVEDYRRDWSGQPDMPYAKEAFGSVIAAPLIFGDEVMGILEVIQGQQGRRFDREDVRLLDLLGPQAAVAITNSRLFERQRGLTEELEAAKNQLETVLTSTENPVIALNRRLEVIFANPAAAALFDGLPLSGRQIREIAPAHILPANPGKALRELRQRRTYIYEMVIRDRTYLCHLGLLGRPRSRGFVAVLNDVSQLKELDRLKNQMIRMTSHDLKNPLSAAMFHVELIQEEGEEILTPDMRADINTIWTQLLRMNRIISGILDLERIQSGTLTYEECSVEQIVNQSAHEFGDQARQKGISLRVEVPANLSSITGDRQQLVQAVNNLVENSIKFTSPGGTIKISAEQVENHVVIHVADNGIGIPADAQPRVFERFFRAYHPGAEQIGGTGLGLSLVKAVVDAHNGRTWLESELNRGTTVHLVLPARHGAFVGGHHDEIQDLYAHGG